MLFMRKVSLRCCVVPALLSCDMAITPAAVHDTNLRQTVTERCFEIVRLQCPHDESAFGSLEQRTLPS